MTPARRFAPSAAAVSWAALGLSILAVIMSVTGVAGAAKGTPSPTHKPSPGRVVRLGADGRIPAKYLPKITAAQLPKIPAKDLPKLTAKSLPTVNNAKKVGGQTVNQLTPSCPPTTVDLGTWCMDSAPYPLTNDQIGKNDYFFASQACVAEGGFLPTAAQLIGAANRVKLESTIDDSPLTATVEQDPTRGLQDQREMSSTLITTVGGSDAAGSEGVTTGSTGNPMEGQPDPVPQPAVPEPETLQYVTVYDNHNKGGFAGSESVSQPENFRCAYEKAPGASSKETN